MLFALHVVINFDALSINSVTSNNDLTKPKLCEEVVSLVQDDSSECTGMSTVNYNRCMCIRLPKKQ